MATIHYFNIYSLNFSHLRDIERMIDSCQDPLKPQLQKAFEATKLKAKAAEEKVMSNAISSMLGGDEMPGFHLFAQTLKDIEQADQYRDNLLERFEGADPFAVQELVHNILGISNSVEPPFSKESRQRYFLLMKESGFLQTDYSTVNTEDEQPIHYQPHILASSYLEEHPEVQTLAMGCGEAGQTYTASCHFRRAEDHEVNLFSIGLTANMGPDLVVGMHDADFWKSIPNERFENIVDHTFGYSLFDDQNSAETIQHIYRTLKPDGHLRLEHDFCENHIFLLKKTGFEMDADDPKIARKRSE